MKSSYKVNALAHGQALHHYRWRFSRFLREVFLLENPFLPSPKPRVASHWRHLAQGVEVLATGLFQRALGSVARSR